MCGSVAKKTKRAAEGIVKEDSGCRKRFRNGGSYGRADFTGRRAYGARGGQGDPARGRAYDKKRRDACADGTERCGKVDTGVSVSYTHLTLPTNREGKVVGVAGVLQDKR